jgi:hypothetical protein
LDGFRQTLFHKRADIAIDVLAGFAESFAEDLDGQS